MEDKTTATTSARWDVPVWDADGNHWTARARSGVTSREHAAGIEPVVFGPTLDACVRETARMDRLWALFPARHGDDERSRERVRFLASGGASGGADGGAA